jgi:hypothetical protein
MGRGGWWSRGLSWSGEEGIDRVDERILLDGFIEEPGRSFRFGFFFKADLGLSRHNDDGNVFG